jgi:hypothetical protein
MTGLARFALCMVAAKCNLCATRRLAGCHDDFVQRGI